MEKIKDCIAQIIVILDNTDSEKWIQYFTRINNDLHQNTDNRTFKNILSIFSGAGSFSDLVLYNNGKLCMDKNNELEDLRKQLYHELVKKVT